MKNLITLAIIASVSAPALASGKFEKKSYDFAELGFSASTLSGEDSSTKDTSGHTFKGSIFTLSNKYTEDDKFMIGMNGGIDRAMYSEASGRITADTGLNTLYVMPVVGFELQDNFIVYGKVGYGLSFGTVTASAMSRSVDMDIGSTGMRYGFGAKYKINRIALGVEYEMQKIDGEISYKSDVTKVKGSTGGLFFTAGFNF